jgi:hypothetical protein
MIPMTTAARKIVTPTMFFSAPPGPPPFARFPTDLPAEEVVEDGPGGDQRREDE